MLKKFTTFLFGKAKRPKTFTGQSASRLFRPEIEILEARMLLSTFDWTGAFGLKGGNFNWSSPGNWLENNAVTKNIPGANDVVQFNKTTDAAIVDQDFTIKTLLVAPGRVELNSSLTVKDKCSWIIRRGPPKRAARPYLE